MKNKENISHISRQAWRSPKTLRKGQMNDNGEGLDWLNPLAYAEASELAGFKELHQHHGNFTSSKPWCVAIGRAVNGGREDFYDAGRVLPDTKYGGGPSGEGDERYYT